MNLNPLTSWIDRYVHIIEAAVVVAALIGSYALGHHIASAAAQQRYDAFEAQVIKRELVAEQELSRLKDQYRTKEQAWNEQQAIRDAQHASDEAAAHERVARADGNAERLRLATAAALGQRDRALSEAARKAGGTDVALESQAALQESFGQLERAGRSAHSELEQCNREAAEWRARDQMR